MDTVNQLLVSVRDLIDATQFQIDNKPGGSTQDAALLRVLERLTSAVEELAKRMPTDEEQAYIAHHLCFEQ